MKSAPEVRACFSGNAFNGIGDFQAGKDGRPGLNAFRGVGNSSSASNLWDHQGSCYFDMLTMEFCEGYFSDETSGWVYESEIKELSKSDIGLKSDSSVNVDGMYIGKARLVTSSQFIESPFKLGDVGDEIYTLLCHTIAQYIYPSYKSNLLATMVADESTNTPITFTDGDTFDKYDRYNTFCYASGQLAQLQTGHSATSGDNTKSGYTKQEYQFMVNLMFYLNKRILKEKDFTTKNFKDTKAPNKPVVKWSSDKNNFEWADPGDNGTSYRYRIEKQSSGGALQTVTLSKTFTNKKGVTSYRYLISSDKNAQITLNNLSDTEELTDRKVDIVSLRGDNLTGDLYFHIVAVDGAGNISSTSHYSDSNGNPLVIPEVAEYDIGFWFENEGYTSINKELDGKFDDWSNYAVGSTKTGKAVIGSEINLASFASNKTGFKVVASQRGSASVVQSTSLPRVTITASNNGFKIFYRRWRYALKLNSSDHTWANNDTVIRNLKYDTNFTLPGFETYYTRKLTVKFDSQGGEAVPDIEQDFTLDKWVSGDLNLADKSVIRGTEFGITTDNATVSFDAVWRSVPYPNEIPMPVRLGSMFFGWFPKVNDGNLVCDGLEKDVDIYSRLVVMGITPTSSVTLYARYNVKPRFVDIEDGYFFEGQKVSYDDLLHLVTVDDYEDDLLLLYNQAIDEWAFDMTEKLEEKISRYSEIETDDDSEEERNQLHIDKLRQEQDNIDAIAEKAREIAQEFSSIHPAIKQIRYYSGINESSVVTYTSGASDRLVYSDIGDIVRDIEYPDGSYVTLAEPYDKSRYKNTFLDTRSENVGYFDVLYQVSDTGIPIRGIMRELDLSRSDLADIPAVGVIPGTDVIAEYERKRLHIQFNYNPTVIPKSLQSFTSEDYDGDLAGWLLQYQLAHDPEDNQSNEPWWSKHSMTATHGENAVEQTISKLTDTIHITGISKILLDGAFRYKYPETARKFLDEFAGCSEDATPVDRKEYVEKLYSFYGSRETYSIENGYRIFKGDVWDNIVGIQFTLDTQDQWGKTSSGHSDNPLVDVSRMPKGYGVGFADWESLTTEERLKLLEEANKWALNDIKDDIDKVPAYLFNSFVVGTNWNHTDTYDKNLYQDSKERSIWLNLFFDKSSIPDKDKTWVPDPDPDDPDPDNPDNPNPGLIQGLPDRVEVDTSSTQVNSRLRYVTDTMENLKRSFWGSGDGKAMLEDTWDNTKETQEDWDHEGSSNGVTIRVKDHTK